MRRLRVLMTNNTLAARAGTELYVHDVATTLVARGHTPVAYSTVLGEVAEALRRKGVPVVDRLDALAEPPDVIHGQHHVETLTALLHFPGVPAVSFCHGFLPWEEEPLLFPRVRRHVGVDSATRDRLVLGHAVPPERICVIPNFVDLERFTLRAPLPPRPRRALVFSNHAGEARLVPEVREACASAGIAVDVLGLRSGTASASPEMVLPGYDLVFATGRSALEAMAVGAAVVLAEVVGVGPMVTAERFDELREANFGLRALRSPVSAEAVARQVARYDAADAALVSRRVRAVAGLGAAVDRLLAVYEEVVAEHARVPVDPALEGPAAAAHLRRLCGPLKNRHQVEHERDLLRAECDHLRRLTRDERQRHDHERSRLEGALEEARRVAVPLTTRALRRLARLFRRPR